MLASRITALILKEDKSNPEPSADSNLNKKIYSSATRVTLFLLLLLLLLLEKQIQTIMEKSPVGGFPGGAVVENLPANVGDTGSSPALVQEDPTCRGATEPVCPNY